jgi:hypothetical protein
MLAGVAALAGLGGLLHDRSLHSMEIGGRHYVFPPETVSSSTAGPPVFVRLRPGGGAFEIVHDGRLSGKHDRAGVPHIFSVNDHGGHDLVYARSNRSIVVCRRASSPTGGCGTWVQYGGVTWSVLFPESRAGEADEFARQAAAELRTYDTRVLSIVQ